MVRNNTPIGMRLSRARALGGYIPLYHINANRPSTFLRNFEAWSAMNRGTPQAFLFNNIRTPPLSAPGVIRILREEATNARLNNMNGRGRSTSRSRSLSSSVGSSVTGRRSRSRSTNSGSRSLSRNTLTSGRVGGVGYVTPPRSPARRTTVTPRAPRKPSRPGSRRGPRTGYSTLPAGRPRRLPFNVGVAGAPRSPRPPVTPAVRPQRRMPRK